jgi:ankyrin repeat protein
LRLPAQSLIRCGSRNIPGLRLEHLLLRKCDWHDAEGLHLVLEHAGDPNWMVVWGKTALHQAVCRDNSLEMIETLLDYGADPAVPDRESKSAIMIAAGRGPAAALDLFEQRGTLIRLIGIDALIAACVLNQKVAITLNFRPTRTQGAARGTGRNLAR